MKPSQACIDLIKHFERLELNAYPCPAGKWTIGYGHTVGVRKGDRCTPAQAEQWLAEDLAAAVALVDGNVRVPLTQGQYDAMLSIVFNVGPGKKGVKDGIIVLRSGQPSTLLRKLNAGEYSAAAAEFGRWIYANRKPLRGLILRRAAERALFERSTNDVRSGQSEPSTATEALEDGNRPVLG